MDEYDPGKRLRLYYTPSTADPSDGPGQAGNELELELEILHAFKPFTMSVVCHARISSPPSLPLPSHLPSTCIVKLFDRRYVSNIRETYDQGRPYSASKEAAYQRYLLHDPPFLPKDRANIYRLGKAGDDGGIEAHIEDVCGQFRENEARAYAELAELQGTLVPMLYGVIRYEADLPGGYRYIVRGFLLEHIPSSTLKVFLNEAMRLSPPPYDLISAVCDQAIQLMDRVDEFKVLNKDTRLDNVLVVPSSHQLSTSPPIAPVTTSSPSYRCVAIDFGCSRLRYPDETDEQWRMAKQRWDERGAIGMIAERVLDELCEGRDREVDRSRLWRYSRSARWDRELSEEEMKAIEEDEMWGLYVEDEHD